MPWSRRAADDARLARARLAGGIDLAVGVFSAVCGARAAAGVHAREALRPAAAWVFDQPAHAARFRRAIGVRVAVAHETLAIRVTERARRRAHVPAGVVGDAAR